MAEDERTSVEAGALPPFARSSRPLCGQPSLLVSNGDAAAQRFFPFFREAGRPGEEGPRSSAHEAFGAWAEPETLCLTWSASDGPSGEDGDTEPVLDRHIEIVCTRMELILADGRAVTRAL